MTEAENGRRINWKNLAPSLAGTILASLVVGVVALYKKVDNSFYTISDLQEKQIEQAAEAYTERKEMTEAIFKLSLAVEKLIEQNDNQDEMIKDLKESLKDKSFKKQE